MDKRLRELLIAAREQGWIVEDVKKGYALKSPDGRGMVVVHKTPSGRWLHNTLPLLRRYGFVWPWPGKKRR